MRVLQASLVASVLLAAASPGFAQSAYDYPWCAVYGGRGSSGAMSCYYSTYAQCMATISGIGGYCTRSPYYNAGGPRGDRRRRDYRDY